MNGHSGWRVGAHQLSAFRSCAKQIGLPIEVVLRAAQTGQLGKLIEKRSGRITERRNLARIDSLYRRRELSAKVTGWGVGQRRPADGP